MAGAWIASGVESSDAFNQFNGSVKRMTSFTWFRSAQHLYLMPVYLEAF
jgi:hypothetical protein